MKLFVNRLACGAVPLQAALISGEIALGASPSATHRSKRYE